ncbi:proprotein convertase subtilisin/kexin type 1 inhibitor, like [Hippocampus zosterae]|uniref:proprotein convertase subtilisin/kexin type 1 inhibitor, like n=1 Tax=Hippocampus zosterae TaxID=109293 RepID=UPI00223D0EFE|nr:proprotein convertase subtilisin/kexin type 1 inhibitor, like [Hippocampus zosterae]
MASLGLLVLGAALLQAAQCALAARGGVGRQNLLAYDDDRDEVMSYPAYYRSDGWSGPSLEQALQRLVERGQRREQDQEEAEEEEEEDEEQQRRTATIATLLRFLAKAEAAGSVDPGDLQMEGKDFRGRGRGASMGRPPAAWWTLVTPQLLQALLDRMEPRVGGAQLAKTRLERFRGDNYEDLGDDVRHLLARILPIISPDDGPSNRRARRDLSVAEPPVSARRRSRRSLGDEDDAPPSDSEPLLRVKRLGEEEQEGRRLQAPPNANARYGARRRRAALNHALLHQIVNYMRK